MKAFIGFICVFCLAQTTWAMSMPAPTSDTYNGMDIPNLGGGYGEYFGGNQGGIPVGGNRYPDLAAVQYLNDRGVVNGLRPPANYRRPAFVSEEARFQILPFYPSSRYDEPYRIRHVESSGQLFMQ